MPNTQEDPSLQIRPTQKAIRQNLLKDLQKPGYIIITHTGDVITRPIDSQELPEEKCPKS